MVKSTFLSILGVLGLLKPQHLASPAKAFGNPKISVEKKYDLLERSNFRTSYVHEFARQVAAQDLPPSAFRELLISGEKNAVSHFLEPSPFKKDYLEEEHVDIILFEPGLQFHDGNGGYSLVNRPERRAIAVLLSAAEFSESGLARLALNRDTALTIMALFGEQLFSQDRVVNAIGHASGFRPADIKQYSRMGQNFRAEEGSSITQVDIIVLAAMRKNASTMNLVPRKAVA